MSWNNGKETAIFNNKMKHDKEIYTANGMDDMALEELIRYESDQLKARRNNESYATTVPLYVLDRNGEEIVNPEVEEQCSTEIELDPFEFGFDDERLNQIITKADTVDLQILHLLAEGYSQPKIAAMMHLHQTNISRRIRKMSENTK